MAELSDILGQPFRARRPQRPPSRYEAVMAFTAAMHNAGILPLVPIVDRLLDGELVRFRTEGDKRGRANGWARFSFDPVPHGSFGSWRLGISESWSGTEIRILSDRERTAVERNIRMARARSDAEKLKRQREVAADAHRRWLAATRVDPKHSYLLAKNMTGEGLLQEGQFLIARMRDVNARTWNLQRIAPDGTKRFLKGGRVKGLFWMPTEPRRSICIGEGVATMSAVRAATNLPVAAAMSAQNLLEVARAIRARWPELEIIICADDDANSAENKGVAAAAAAATAVAGRLAIPPRRPGHV